MHRKSPNPLKVGDKPEFTITYQNISNKQIIHPQQFGCCQWFDFTISPSDNVQEHLLPVGTGKLMYGSVGEIQPNQIVTDAGRGIIETERNEKAGLAGSTAEYQITKIGMLTITANMWLPVGSSDLFETIQFNVNATQ